MDKGGHNTYKSCPDLKLYVRVRIYLYARLRDRFGSRATLHCRLENTANVPSIYLNKLA